MFRVVRGREILTFHSALTMYQLLSVSHLQRPYHPHFRGIIKAENALVSKVSWYMPGLGH